MYPRCLSCDRSLGTNAELPHLPIGRRVAFDRATGRLWVICTRCDQWNLVPLEERWEALEDCERVAGSAEVRAPGDAIGFARTARGLELLRVSGHDSVDIANWRYARRFSHRRFALVWIASALGVMATLLGVRGGIETGSAWVGVYITAVLGLSVASWWQRLPRLWVAVRDRASGTRVWPWQIGRVRLARFGKDARPTLLVPDGRHDTRLHGDDAARMLAILLPRVNGADCVNVSLAGSLRHVEAAEHASARRHRQGAERSRDAGAVMSPWEHIAARFHKQALVDIEPETRVALEMAVTEELEHADLAARSSALEGGLRAEEEIASIADDLLMPADIVERIEREKQKGKRKAR